MDIGENIEVVVLPELKKEGPKHVDISTFKESKELHKGLSWVLQMKGFNRKERISRHLSQVCSGVVGSSTDREISPGAVMIFSEFRSEGIQKADAGPTFLVLDSRGMVVDEETRNCYFASVDTVYKLNLDRLDVEEVTSSDKVPLAFIHSLALSTDKQKMLITSAGLDSIVEVRLDDGKLNRQWVAWEHGFNRAKKSGKLVYPVFPYPQPEEDFVVFDISQYGKGLGLPPAERTAFPNSAIYLDDNRVLATMFHHGLVSIDLNSGETVSIDTNLRHPHSILPFRDGYIVTNTAVGSAKIYDSNVENSTILDYANLPGLDPDAEGRQWLQHVHPLSDSKLAAIDSNRVSIVLVDLQQETYQRIPYEDDWVIQEIHPLPKLNVT